MGSNPTLVTLSSCWPMKLRGPKNKNLYDTIKRSIQFIRVTRLVSIVDYQQFLFISLVDLVSERKLNWGERRSASHSLTSARPNFPSLTRSTRQRGTARSLFLKKLLCLVDGEGKQKKIGIKQVDKVRILHRKRITKLTFRALALRRHFPIRLRRRRFER